MRFARKHLSWYVKHLPGGRLFLVDFHRIEDASDQLSAVAEFFSDQRYVSNNMADIGGLAA